MIARALVVALVVAVLVAFFAFDVEQHLTLEAFAAHREVLIRFADSHRPTAVALAFVVYALGVALCLPAGLVFALACGLVFGRALGTSIGVAGETAGATLAFLVARFLLANAVQRRFAPLIARIDAALAQNGFWWLVFFRAAPIYPYAVVNVAPALSSVPARTFALATFVAAIPATFVYANLGATLGGATTLDEATWLRTVGALALVALLALLPILVRRLQRRA
ncbi:MAG TPA: VTT domain-containing protein [Casimicrobiaceae bacterium]